MYYQDSPGSFNNITPSEIPFNEGMALRRQITQSGHGFDLIFKPHVEVFNQNRVLLPCDIRLKFGRNSRDFYVMCKETGKAGKIIINESTLYLRTLKFKQNFEDSLVKTVEKAGGAMYPYVAN